MIQKKVRAFGTPESKSGIDGMYKANKHSDVFMKKEDEEIVFDSNNGFQDAYDKENSAERADHIQPQSFKDTPEVIFIV